MRVLLCDTKYSGKEYIYINMYVFCNTICMKFNNIQGSLPMFKNVELNILTANQFTGSIPTEYGLLGNLNHNFGITGTAPTE